MRFDGPDIDPKLDGARLERQHERIERLMRDQVWRTLDEIAAATGDPVASVSAQLRHLRKAKFGSYRVLKRRRGAPGSGLFEYQVLPPLPVGQLDLAMALGGAHG